MIAHPNEEEACQEGAERDKDAPSAVWLNIFISFIVPVAILRAPDIALSAVQILIVLVAVLILLSNGLIEVPGVQALARSPSDRCSRAGIDDLAVQTTLKT